MAPISRYRTLVILFAALVAGLSCLPIKADPEVNLLRDRLPLRAQNLHNPAALTDGIAAREGQRWDLPLATRFLAAQSGAVYDLGAPRILGCVWLQGDNNDEYVVEGSTDGRVYQVLWVAPVMHEPGLRLRFQPLSAVARYLRLSPRAGDDAYSVTEFGASAACPSAGPRAYFRRAWLASAAELTLVMLWISALLLGTFVLKHRQGGTRYSMILLAAGVLAGLGAMLGFVRLFPFFPGEAALRAAVALVAGTIALREGFGRHPANRRLLTTLLTVLALLSAASYYHLGALQFRDAAKGRKTFVHGFDMRHYFPLAKYFPELRFDGLYLASLAAYEDETGIPAQQMPGVRLRDLDTSEMRYAPEVAARLPEIRARFTPQRWTEFRRDMRYFMDMMGHDYLGSMQDHGGNATPVWVLTAWLLFRNLPANEWTLTLSGLIDPLLLLTLFIATWRSFGLRVMLYSVILFGATDFHMFGSNLAGSTLRQDWLVALGLGACALKTRRWMLGGGLLAYAGLIRAFPAMATFFLAAPILWWIVDRLRGRANLDLAALWREQQPALRAGLSAVITVATLFTASSVAFGLDAAWGNWLRKIEIHATGPSINNVGLRNAMSYAPQKAAKHVLRQDHPEPWIEWQRAQTETYAARRPWTYAIMAAVLGLSLLACRGLALHGVVLVGLLTVPFLFYPSNYYCHFIFLLPLALGAGTRTFAWLMALLALLCVGQYFSLLEPWSDLRYTWQSFLLLGTFTLIILPLAWQGSRHRQAGFSPGL